MADLKDVVGQEGTNTTGRAVLRMEADAWYPGGPAVGADMRREVIAGGGEVVTGSGSKAPKVELVFGAESVECEEDWYEWKSTGAMARAWKRAEKEAAGLLEPLVRTRKEYGMKMVIDLGGGQRKGADETCGAAGEERDGEAGGWPDVWGTRPRRAQREK
jgi:hypothetical protein